MRSQSFISEFPKKKYLIPGNHIKLLSANIPHFNCEICLLVQDKLYLHYTMVCPTSLNIAYIVSWETVNVKFVIPVVNCELNCVYQCSLIPGATSHD